MSAHDQVVAAQDDPAQPDQERSRLGEVLVAAGVITDDQLVETVEAQRSVRGSRRRLGHLLVDLGLASERQIAEGLASQLALDVVDLDTTAFAPESTRLLPRAVAQRLGALVLSREDSRMVVAMSDPTDVVALDDLRLHTGATELTVMVATESQVRSHLRRAWSLSQAGSVTALEDVDVTATQEDDGANDAPTVRLVNRILSDAVRSAVSDIHVEPQRDALRIRYRVDGLLREVMTLPRSTVPSLVSRLKIVSGLDIAERRLPQDGRTRILLDGRGVDARVSTMPSIHGEKVVVRLLSQADAVPALEDLGLEADQLAAVRAAAAAAQGLILITGPTGSGKTNTLYSALAEMHAGTRNIVALEDPVEVQMHGITQVQVQERTGLTFGWGLRAVLRQDPDVILVGEVRDRETAELTIKASLTGHLVLATLHTNSAVAAITRLVDMGIEPFLVASSISAVVAQRLVRRPCPGCVVDDEPDPVLLQVLQVDPAELADATPKRGVGCADCADTGYRGRVGVFEVLHVDGALRRVLGADPTELALSEATAGMTGLRHAAVAKAMRGQTTFEEAARVSPRD